MKRLLFIYGLILSVCSTSAYAQETDTAYVRNHYTKIERQITMRDGVKLFTAIYMPKDQSKKYPFLINRTPYTVAPYGEDKYKAKLGQFPCNDARRLSFLFTKMYAADG
jgi:predicted acyl esterase